MICSDSSVKPFTDVYVRHTPDPIFCYRSGLFVYEEAFTRGTLMPCGFSGAGYPMNVLSNYPTCLNSAAFCEPSAFNLELDGTGIDFGLEYKDFIAEPFGEGLHAVLTLKSTVKPVEIEVHTWLDGTNVITRSLSLRSLSDRSLCLSRLSVMAGGYETMGGLTDQNRHLAPSEYYELGCFDSSDGAYEGDFCFRPLPYDRTTLSGRFARRRSRHPAFYLKNKLSGSLLFAQLAFSGGYDFVFDYDAGDQKGDTALSYKIAVESYHPLFVLAPGQVFHSPEVHLGMIFGDLDDAVNEMNTHIRRSVLNEPECDPSACLVGAGMGAEHDMSVETSKRFIDQLSSLGCEVFIIDAGWNCPPHRENEWAVRVGNWDFDTERYPNGIAEVREYAHRKGMKFGMWMEVERIGGLSALHSLHPEWRGISVAGERSDSFVNFADPEAAAWAEEQIAHVIEDYQLDLFRVDYNIGQGEYFHILEGSERECAPLKAFDAVCAMYCRLHKRFPQVIFENCASGGGRTDLAQMKAFNHTWVSDQQRAPRSLLITAGMSMALPPERIDRLVAGMGGHTLASLDFQMRNTMFGHMSVNVFSPAAAEENPQQLEFIRHSIALYKDFIRPFLPESRVFHHTPDTREMIRTGVCVMELASRSGDRGMIGVFTLPGSDGTVQTVYPRGIDASKTYRVYDDNTRTSAVFSGADLLGEGLRIRVAGTYTSGLLLYSTAE